MYPIDPLIIIRSIAGWNDLLTAALLGGSQEQILGIGEGKLNGLHRPLSDLDVDESRRFTFSETKVVTKEELINPSTIALRVDFSGLGGGVLSS